MTDNRIESIIKSLADINNTNFFNDICLALSKAIFSDFVFIATLSPNRDVATTIALCKGDELLDNFSYALEQTPCANVRDEDVCTHTEGIQALYPEDELLVDMGVEGYVGVPLRNVEGETIALLVSLYTTPIQNSKEIETLFLLFSGLIEKELHKRDYSQELELTNTIIENSQEAIIICDDQSTIIHVNQAFSDITGFRKDEVLGKKPNLLNSGVHDGDFYKEMWNTLNETKTWQGEIWNRRKNNPNSLDWVSISAVYNSQQKLTHYVSFFSDITEYDKAKNKIERQKYFDSLTKLANKTLLNERMEKIALNNSSDSRTAVYYIDIDLFKNINNTYGHKFGDRLLILIASRLKSIVKGTDTIARTGGDKFTLLMPNVVDDKEVENFALEIERLFENPFHIDGRTTSCTVSIGIALHPDDSPNPDGLFKKAEQAMYDAKDNGRNLFSFFTKGMEDNTKRITQLKNDIELAIKQKDFGVVYQPIISVTDQSVNKFEALVRWNHNGKWVSPVDFIPIAERFNLIKPIGEIVLKEACKQLKRLEDSGFKNLVFNVNRSIYEFHHHENSAELWLEIIKNSGLQPHNICFELTESVLAPENDRNLVMLNELQMAGCNIALDDFGTGYSSISYLRRFSIDVLKIDRDFIRDMHVVKDDKTLVSTIIAMAKSLDITVVAEGAEIKEQIDLLTDLGCDFIQGYYFSKPLAPELLADYLRHFDYHNPN
ncbi:putative bifunctional diguanylate cyclase/phosphodiesterase [Aliivibrio kagoshimensis]|uniref:putative bifunctional diguanylate cyclase/phosphodiesterase n=1 Tax=Aliivibrio kagoshimensis TaxID=2910230 RepID=UPI003D13F91C